MSSGTSIEWTHVPGYRPATWNPITTTEGSWPRLVDFHEGRLDEPLNQEEPTCYAVGDIFDDVVPDEIIDRIFAVMARCPQHLFAVLTKHAKRMKRYFTDPNGYNSVCSEVRTGGRWPLPNVWLGVLRKNERAS